MSEAKITQKHPEQKDKPTQVHPEQTHPAQRHPEQKHPAQRPAEAHDDNALESLGKAIIDPVQTGADTDTDPRRD